MIEGAVNAACEPVARLSLEGPSGRSREVDTVLDTGFNGFLKLPPALIVELELPFPSEGQATLASNSLEFFDVYGVTALWDGHPRFVDVDEADTAPLLGMALLDGYSLYLEVADGARWCYGRWSSPSPSLPPGVPPAGNGPPPTAGDTVPRRGFPALEPRFGKSAAALKVAAVFGRIPAHNFTA